MAVTRCSETSVYNKPTRRHIPEDGILHSRRHENLKSYTTKICPPVFCLHFNSCLFNDDVRNGITEGRPWKNFHHYSSLSQLRFEPRTSLRYGFSPVALDSKHADGQPGVTYPTAGVQLFYWLRALRLAAPWNWLGATVWPGLTLRIQEPSHTPPGLVFQQWGLL
jgi:hypothetical protein